jgi:hypothetical protein
MGADWYFIRGFYGYEIKISDDSSFGDIINTLEKLGQIIDKSFKFAAILSEFHSRIEDMGEDELRDMYSGSTIIIGFETINDLGLMLKKSEELKEYITDNPILIGIEFVETPGFFYGIDRMEHLYEMYYNDTSDDDENADDNSSLSDDSDESDVDEDYYNSSDDDEDKVMPITEMNKCKIE